MHKVVKHKQGHFHITELLHLVSLAKAKGIKVVGLLLDLLQVNQQVQLLIEKVLGFSLFTFILEDKQDLEQLVELIKESNCSNTYNMKVLGE